MATKSEDFLGTNSSELHNIYSLKSNTPFLNRLFDTNIECISSFFVILLRKNQVLKPKTRVRQATILKFGRSIGCFVLFRMSIYPKGLHTAF